MRTIDNTENNIKQIETVESLAALGHSVGCVTRFVLLFYGFMSINREFGEESVTIVELSILITIIENNGISASEVSRKWKKTKGAVSQMLKKLEERELIYKERNKKDGKIYGLYPTEKGKRVVENYYMLDTPESPVIFEEMRKTFSLEEIRSFYLVMDKYSEILMQIL